jgi:hypothetical protein
LMEGPALRYQHEHRRSTQESILSYEGELHCGET